MTVWRDDAWGRHLSSVAETSRQTPADNVTERHSPTAQTHSHAIDNSLMKATAMVEDTLCSASSRGDLITFIYMARVVERDLTD